MFKPLPRVLRAHTAMLSISKISRRRRAHCLGEDDWSQGPAIDRFGSWLAQLNGG